MPDWRASLAAFAAEGFVVADFFLAASGAGHQAYEFECLTVRADDRPVARPLVRHLKAEAETWAIYQRRAYCVWLDTSGGTHLDPQEDVPHGARVVFTAEASVSP